jgi:hypothetical protein
MEQVQALFPVCTNSPDTLLQVFTHYKFRTMSCCPAVLDDSEQLHSRRHRQQPLLRIYRGTASEKQGASMHAAAMLLQEQSWPWSCSTQHDTSSTRSTRSILHSSYLKSWPLPDASVLAAAAMPLDAYISLIYSKSRSPFLSPSLFEPIRRCSLDLMLLKIVASGRLSLSQAAPPGNRGRGGRTKKNRGPR